ncbi:hypothetical protein CH253_17805 [Rhodococcus sp. 06-156-3C]|nr:hypothetical protein CH280_07130 [Rhodococcus sp. 06-156-4C]OZD18915.1 hypothetical protein CH253_17805 [Rhodococcus sp. 06-156-3C]OZD22425.1 hypothetical protein CH248_09390 [Rhodococcus sp. 06-156-4a]OZD34009.1 hypothetical protein CH247_07920 [Rhodococcus sp. 06-156-3b]OZD38746.1 hypothetical protein CH284_06340 [Rhodococcus sp. 06-156-3]OZF57206.1 hypothetical protein CH290_27125 [Rhodococcus sp. 06-156-4]
MLCTCNLIERIDCGRVISGLAHFGSVVRTGWALLGVEEGCAEFSNITGLSQLRYPANRISATYEDLR